MALRVPLLDETRGQARVAEIAARLPDARSLGDLVRWGLEQRPPRLVVDVIAQDEFTHDVVLPLDEHVVLVLETT